MEIKDLKEHINKKRWSDKSVSNVKLFKFGAGDVGSSEPISAEEFGSYFDENMSTAYKLYNKNILGNVDENPLKKSGVRIKLPFRVDSNCFKEMIDLKVSGESCSYVSCVDELLESNYVPQRIPALLMSCDVARAKSFKSRGRIYSMTAEKFGSKMLNFFEVPTMFCENLTFKSDGGDQQYVACVDFIKHDELMITLQEYFAQYIYPDEAFLVTTKTLDDVIDMYSQVYKTHYHYVQKEFGLPDDFNLEKEIGAMQQDVAYRYLVRKYGMGDGDYFARNIGVSVNKKTHKIGVSAEFDLEEIGYFDKTVIPEDFRRMFGEAQEQGISMNKLMNLYFNYYGANYVSVLFDKDIEQISRNYPNAMEKFINKSNELLEKDENNISKLDEFLSVLQEGVICDSNDLNDKEKIANIFESNFMFVKAVSEYYAEKDNAMES